MNPLSFRLPVPLLCKAASRGLVEPAVSLLGIYPKESKAETRTETCSLLFIATLFTTTKGYEPPKRPSVDE